MLGVTNSVSMPIVLGQFSGKSHELCSMTSAGLQIQGEQLPSNSRSKPLRESTRAKSKEPLMAASKTDRQVFVLFPPREVQIHPTAPPWLALDPRLPVVVSGVKFLRQILQKSCVAGLTTRCLLGRVLQHTAVFILIRFQQLLRAGRAVRLSCG